MSILGGHSISSILYFALHFYAWLARDNEKEKEDEQQDSKLFRSKFADNSSVMW